MPEPVFFNSCTGCNFVRYVPDWEVGSIEVCNLTGLSTYSKPCPLDSTEGETEKEVQQLDS